MKQVEPLSTHLLKKCKEYWNPGTDLAVDESMERFQGRSHDTLTIPSKPEPTGFKIWCTAQLGYTLHWIYHQKSKGPVGIKPPKGLNKTNAVVVRSLEALPKQPYCAWLDNLFVSHKLLTHLRSKGFGAAGTARKNSGIVKKLAVLKESEKGKDIYPWGTVIKEISQDNQVMEMLWKDNDFVLFQSTVHTGDEEPVTQNRKRPSKTSSKAKTARAPFGDQPRKDLDIPLIAYEYNHKMNQVDIADHLASSSAGLHKIHKGWKALWWFLCRRVVVNAFLLSYYSNVPKEEKFTNQTNFREELIGGLFDKSQRLIHKRRRSEWMKAAVPLNSNVPHQLEWLGKERSCQVCGTVKRRRILGELDNNVDFGGRKKSVYGCKACDVSLCKEGLCFDRFHECT